jgi:hypothetical protein
MRPASGMPGERDRVVAPLAQHPADVAIVILNVCLSQVGSQAFNSVPTSFLDAHLIFRCRPTMIRSKPGPVYGSNRTQG